MIGRYLELIADGELKEEAKEVIKKQLISTLNKNHKKQCQKDLIVKYIKSLYGIESVTKIEIEKNINDAIYLETFGKKIFKIINKNIARSIIGILLKIPLYIKINKIEKRRKIMNEIIKELSYA